MRGRAWKTTWTRRIVIFSVLFLAYALGNAGAAEQQKQSEKKAVTKAKATTTAKTKALPKIAAPAAAAISEDVALASFDAFTLEWMKKLADTEEFRKTRAQIKPATEGFSAEYTGYLPHRYIHIKKTESSDTPYVGILTYYEKTLRCTGKTKEEAMKGPFDQVETNQVSEIFRFTKGKWVY